MQSEQYKTFIKAFAPFYQAILDELPKQFAQYIGMRDSLSAFFGPLMPLAEHGKRIRPYLITIAADNLSDQALKAAAAYEILHLFALVHDDIIDGATHRRGVPTAHVAYEKLGVNGTSGAILLGDYLLVLANDLMRQANAHVSPLFSEIQFYLCFGQFYELHHWGKKIERPVVEQIELFKSAQYSFQYPLRIGFALSGKDLQQLDEFATACGLAFQLRDDWLDYSGAEADQKDQVDEKNGVANMVQLLFQELEGNANAVEQKVEAMLAEYKKQAMDALEKSAISQDQKAALTDILVFSTTLA